MAHKGYRGPILLMVVLHAGYLRVFDLGRACADDLRRGLSLSGT